MIGKISQINYNQSYGNNTEPLNKKKKAIILASAAAGMTPVLAVLAKRKGFSLNPIKIFKTPMKEWAIFKYKPENKAIDFGPEAIIATATGSVIGGFAGGAAVDKKNIKAKKREILNQILGNVIVPVGCVWAGSELYNGFAEKIEKMMPQLKESGKLSKIFNSCSKNFPKAVGTLGFLSIGIYCGNRVSNFINEKLYHKKVDRSIKATDFAPHVDDLCMATTMMNKGSDLGAKIGRVIPFALLVPGYQTGIACDK